jgi:iron complex outermembrane receptor protein
VQYGGSLDKGKHDYRIYTKYQNDDHLPNAAGQDGGDGWHLLDGGVRTDSTLSEKDGLMTQGNLYTGQVALPEFALLSFSPPTQHFVDLLAPLSGGYVQSVWNHAFSSRSDTSLQGSYDTYERDDELREGRNTLTVDFQHHIALRDRQDVRWGFTYVYTSSRSNGSLTASLRPPDLEYSAFSSFLQDEIALIPDQVYLTIGVKAERNNYTGWTAMPSARLAWQANQRNMFWAAFSSAVRTPDELDAAFRVNFGALTGPGGIPVLVGVAGNPNYQNEGLAATEAGYRTTFSSRISLDIAAYYNHYTHQQTTEPITPFLESTPPPPYAIF